MLFTTTTHSDIKCTCSTFYISRLSLESMVIKRFGVSPPSHLTISPHFRLRGQPKWLPHRLWWWRMPNLSPVSAVGDASHLTERWDNCHDLLVISFSPLSSLSARLPYVFSNSFSSVFRTDSPLSTLPVPDLPALSRWSTAFHPRQRILPAPCLSSVYSYLGIKDITDCLPAYVCCIWVLSRSITTTWFFSHHFEKKPHFPA